MKGEAFTKGTDGEPATLPTVPSETYSEHPLSIRAARQRATQRKRNAQYIAEQFEQYLAKPRGGER
jgi:hypothetical protein